MTSTGPGTGSKTRRPTRRFRRRTVRIEVDYASSEEAAIRECATTLGAGGLFIESERPLPRKSVLKLSFSLPGRPQRHELEGRVVWAEYPARPGDQPRKAGMGIQFTDRVGEALLARELEDWESPSEA